MSNRVDCSDKLKESEYSCDSNELKKSMTSTGNCRNNELYASLYELKMSLYELKMSLYELKMSLYELKRSLYELKTSQELTTSLTSTRTVR